MENKTRWEFHKEEHLGDRYRKIETNATEILRMAPPYVAWNYTLTTINYEHNKKPDEQKLLVFSLFKSNS
jgi:hypothetical protein